ncbi:hypothetical protein [Marinicella sp. W31]|uniref:hypothetical protein n=1 Tax=Marinicella sp. W31 TaxID=3023713 RepID=UPI00375771ED
MKTNSLLILLILTALLMLYKFQGLEDVSTASVGDASDQVSLVGDLIENDTAVGLPVVGGEENFEEKDYTLKEVDDLWGLCGSEFSRSFLSLIEAQPFHVSDFSDIQKKYYDETYRSCLKWYEYISQSHAFERYLTDVKRQSEKAITLLMIQDAKKIDQAVDLAKQVLQGEQDSISEDFALSYLAQFDHALIKKVSDRIGTSNYAYVGASHKDYMKLYFCQRDPSSCAASSSEMLVMCIYDAQLCGMSYPQYLATVRTPHEIANLYAMAEALAEIVAQGYP